jgi:hypothetical protein
LVLVSYGLGTKIDNQLEIGHNAMIGGQCCSGLIGKSGSLSSIHFSEPDHMLASEPRLIQNLMFLAASRC